MEPNTVYVDGLPVGTVVGIDWGAGDAEPQSATTGRRPYQALLAASAVLGGSSLLSACFRAAEDHQRKQVRDRILGKEATHATVDELAGINRQLEFYAEMLQSSPGWVWQTWRTRNLSHRPVAGARKRKAALKQAARTRRAAVAERHYG